MMKNLRQFNAHLLPFRAFDFIGVYRRVSAVAVFAFAAMASASQAQTSAIEQFRAFVQSTQSARADFTQTTTDAKGKVSKPQSGNVQFQRPGKFRWVVDKPA